MLNINEVIETNKMIHEMNLDVRTITMGISLLDCVSDSLDEVCENIYNKITTKAKNLVKVGKEIEQEFGIPIVNKRISITPIALIGGACCKGPEDFVRIAKELDRCAKEVGVNFIGGYSALVNKGMTKADKYLIESIPEALSVTDRVCSSINVGSTKTGINMDAVKMLGEIILETSRKTADIPAGTRWSSRRRSSWPRSSWSCGSRSPHRSPGQRCGSSRRQNWRPPDCPRQRRSSRHSSPSPPL